MLARQSYEAHYQIITSAIEAGYTRARHTRAHEKDLPRGFVFPPPVVCEQAHLFGVSREYLGRGATICEENHFRPPRSPRRLANRGSAPTILARNKPKSTDACTTWRRTATSKWQIHATDGVRARSYLHLGVFIVYFRLVAIRSPAIAIHGHMETSNVAIDLHMARFP